MVKNEFVATYGFSVSVVSGFGAKTRNVAQQPSIFSTRKTLEQLPGVVVQSILSLVVGIVHGAPLPLQVYKVIGLVLQLKVVVPQPKNPRSQVSKQQSPQQLAFCCKILMTVNISAIHLQESFSTLLHI